MITVNIPILYIPCLSIYVAIQPAYLAILRRQLTIQVKVSQPTWPDSALVEEVNRRLRDYFAKRRSQAPRKKHLR